MTFEIWRHKFVGLTFPFFGAMALMNVVIPVQESTYAKVENVGDAGGTNPVETDTL